MNQIKVLLVGPTNVGKTVYVRRVNTGEFNKIYDVTNIFEITKINFLTNKGSLDFVIYDFPGNVDIDKEISKMENIDAFIIMFDLGDVSSFHKSLEIIRKLKENFEEKQFESFYKIVIGNKYDSKPKRVHNHKISDYLNIYGKFQYYPISAKSCLNLQLPFLHISRKINGYDLIFEDDVINFDDDKFDYVEN